MNLKMNFPFNVIGHSASQYVTENQKGNPAKSAVAVKGHLKVIDLDQFSLYDGWYKVNDSFQEHKIFSL